MLVTGGAVGGVLGYVVTGSALGAILGAGAGGFAAWLMGLNSNG